MQNITKIAISKSKKLFIYIFLRISQIIKNEIYEK